MDEIIFCPKCHQLVAQTDYFCPNCGQKLRSRPPSTSLSSLIFLFLKTFFLPPLGLIWGFQYLRQSDNKSKLIGFLVIATTIIEVILLIQSAITITDSVNQQINSLM